MFFFCNQTIQAKHQNSKKHLVTLPQVNITCHIGTFIEGVLVRHCLATKVSFGERQIWSLTLPDSTHTNSRYSSPPMSFSLEAPWAQGVQTTVLSREADLVRLTEKHFVSSVIKWLRGVFK